MERILPIDLDRAKLRKSFRGYESRAVENLLRACADTLRELYEENRVLRESAERNRAELEGYRGQENALKEALLMAQRAAEDTRAAAQRQADAILEEARLAALAERIAVQQRVSELRWELESARKERVRFQEEFQELLRRYQRDATGSLVVVEGEAASAVANG